MSSHFHLLELDFHSFWNHNKSPQIASFSTIEVFDGEDSPKVDSFLGCLFRNSNLCFSSQYFESLLQDVKEETEKEISKAVDKAIIQKLQKMQAKLDRCVKEKEILDDVSTNLFCS